MRKTLNSRKNKVIYADDGGGKYVLKEFSSTERFNNEYGILKKMDGRLSPRILSAENNTLKKEYIEGTELIDVIFSAGDDEFLKAARLFLEYLELFCNVNAGLFLSDLNFHNFIYTGDAVYGVDCEDIEEGCLTDSLSRAVAFCELYGFSAERKKIFKDILLENADGDAESKISAYKSFLISRRGGK